MSARPARVLGGFASGPRAPARRHRASLLLDERGAGAALALAIATGSLLLALLVVGTGSAAIAQARAAAAAEAAALAAADARSGFADGSPCALAHAVASASGARLGDCRIEGLDALVTTTVPVGPLRASGTARAGPPRRRTDRHRGHRARRPSSRPGTRGGGADPAGVERSTASAQ